MKDNTNRAAIAHRLWVEYQILKSYRKVGESQVPPTTGANVHRILKAEGYVDSKTPGKKAEPAPACPKCGCDRTVRNGTSGGRQIYLCKKSSCYHKWMAGQGVSLILSDEIAEKLKQEANPAAIVEQALKLLWDKNTF